MTPRHLFLVAAAVLLASGFVFAQTRPTVVTGSAQPTKKWDSFCAGAVGSGVKNDSVDEAHEPAGWNAVMKRYGEGGWEPYQMLTEGKKISGVCFKRQLP
ncbi:MAG: hypothetical protein JNK82_39110 [Myxococcaceae bacterium]|nr:hypothetical protein [Myxococcaceae bacterium]